MRKRKRSGRISVSVETTEWIDVSDVLDEVEDDDLKSEYESRFGNGIIEVSNLSIQDQIKKIVCDYHGVSYFTDEKIILEHVKEALNLK